MPNHRISECSSQILLGSPPSSQAPCKHGAPPSHRVPDGVLRCAPSSRTLSASLRLLLEPRARVLLQGLSGFNATADRIPMSWPCAFPNSTEAHQDLAIMTHQQCSDCDYGGGHCLLSVSTLAGAAQGLERVKTGRSRISHFSACRGYSYSHLHPSSTATLSPYPRDNSLGLRHGDHRLGGSLQRYEVGAVRQVQHALTSASLFTLPARAAGVRLVAVVFRPIRPVAAEAIVHVVGRKLGAVAIRRIRRDVAIH